MKKKVLICVAHADDETIGCGGAISHHVKNNDKVFCIYMTDGITSRFLNKNSNKKNTLIAQRKKNSLAASKILGFKWLYDFCGDFPDNAMDKVNLLEVIKLIEKAKKKINPDIVYTHHPYDLNVDHQIVSKAVLTAFRPLAKEHWSKIITFETASATDYSYFKNEKIFQPNYFLNIKPYWRKKMQALFAYKSEIKKYPNSRSFKGMKILAQLRGSQNGLDMAEGFCIIKEIKR